MLQIIGQLWNNFRKRQQMEIAIKNPNSEIENGVLGATAD
jgi:hypothetical protein